MDIYKCERVFQYQWIDSRVYTIHICANDKGKIREKHTAKIV